MDLSYPLMIAMTVSLVLIQLNQRIASPILAIINRWMRWFIFSFGLAYLLREFQLIDRPYWILVSICFLLWFLFQTLYNWLMVSAVSQSPVSIFPGYTPNPGGDEWPVQRRLLRERESLRFKGYRHVQALRTEIGAGVYLRCTYYEHPEQKTRLQILFMPQLNGSIVLGCVVNSMTASGLRIVTDNLHVPFGGFYPENWRVERKPFIRSILKLVDHHHKRVRATGDKIVAFERNPASDLDAAQRELDRLNTEMGFLQPQTEREEFGKITHEGRYRIWKEIWMLDYLGRSSRYC